MKMDCVISEGVERMKGVGLMIWSRRDHAGSGVETKGGWGFQLVENVCRRVGEWSFKVGGT